MTFNMRYGSSGIGSYFETNGWNYVQNPRVKRVTSVVSKWNPDIMGTQEGLDNQIKDLRQAWPDYEFWGAGRDDGKKSGEYAGIFFRRTRFVQNEGGHFWLSATPDIPGTVFAGSGNNRMVSWVRLFDLEAQKSYLVANTHWDHVSQESRQLSAELMVERLSAMSSADETLLVLGDLNNTEDSVEVTDLRKGLNLQDAYRLFHGQPEPNEATYHGFNGSTVGSPIDFVLMSPAYSVAAANIVHENFSGLYPSDHFPVQVVLCLEEAE
jgi:endonuclease/exonuclease/phosphatase family metal-dependent hydrolase